MISTIKLTDTIPLRPNQIGSNILEKIIETLRNLYEGKILGRIDAYIIKIVDVNPDSINNGRIDDINASIIYEVEYTAVIFIPVKNEILDVSVYYCNDLGLWCELTDFKSTVIECFCSKSMIKDYQFNEKTDEFIGKTVIKVGSKINVKVISSKINSNSINVLCEFV